MKKSSLITAVLVLFTAIAAIYILWPHEAAAPTAPASANAASNIQKNFFETFREERTQVRQEESRYLGEIIESTSSSAQAKRDAEAAKLFLAQRVEDEFIIESMLLAKDYSDAAVTISHSGVSVVLSKAAITDEDTAKVLDIVCRQTRRPAQDVYIIASDD